MILYEIREYVTPTGNNPFRSWFKSIKDTSFRAKILTRLDRIQLGNFGHYKIIKNGIYELKFSVGPGYRIYFSLYGRRILLLLCGGDKSTQKKDIKKAKSYWKKYRSK